MALQNRTTSLAGSVAPVGALLILAMVCRPTLASAQMVRPPQIGGDQAFSVAPVGTEAAAQAPALIPLTDAARRAVGNLTKLFNQGKSEQVSAKAEQEIRRLTNDTASGPIEAAKFRIGMFFEDVTLNMLRLFSDSRIVKSCTPAFQQAATVVEKELVLLVSKGRGNGAVFGRKAVNTAKARVGCPKV